MIWTKNKSASEQCMVDILEESKQELTLNEIVSEILRRNPTLLSGKTPKKSLYSVLYRREKRRLEYGLPLLFKTIKRRNTTYYSLSLNNKQQ